MAKNTKKKTTTTSKTSTSTKTNSNAGQSVKTTNNDAATKKVEENDPEADLKTAKKLNDDVPSYTSLSNPFTDNKYDEPYTSARESTLNTMKAGLDVPYWGYKDFINERIAWQKGTSSLYNEPAWFYFKIFFKFDTSFGLLGGIFDSSTNGDTDIRKLGGYTTNTAMKYLITLLTDQKYKPYIKGRLDSLYKFICTLSYISSNAPWFFNAIHDVNNALTTDFNDITKKKSIVIDCLQESIDMKLMTMMDYYKFACFDDVNQREIIPENLRKFDMDIVVFQSPLRYLHTSSQSMEGKKTNYKNMYTFENTFNDLMSYKLFTFKNCEFDYESLNSMLPSEFNNGEGFNSKPTIKINYDRVYQHNSNEFALTFVGDAGMLLNGSSVEGDMSDLLDKYTAQYTSEEDTKAEIAKAAEQGTLLDEVVVYGSKKGNGTATTRTDQLKYMHDHPNYYNINSNMYKALVEATEAQVTNYMRLVDGSTALGNIYGDYKSLSHAIKNTAKNLGQSVYSQVKKTGQSFVDRWKF